METLTQTEATAPVALVEMVEVTVCPFPLSARYGYVSA
jgi:hypothetical protein